MMKKFFFGLIAAVLIAVVAVINVKVNNKAHGFSDISLANVEALAEESPWQLSGMECLYAGCRIQMNYCCWVYSNGYFIGVCDIMWGI